MAEKITSMINSFNNTSNKLDKLTYLIKKNPYNAQSYAERAYFHFKQNDFNLASKDCQKAIEIDPVNQGYKRLWNDITLKSIKHYSDMEIYKMNIRNLLQ